MKITLCLVAALALLVVGCAHPARGGSQGDSLEMSPAYTQAQGTAVLDYRQVLADPGPF